MFVCAQKLTESVYVNFQSNGKNCAMDGMKVAIKIEFMRRNVGTGSILAFNLKIGRLASAAINPGFVSEIPVT